MDSQLGTVLLTVGWCLTILVAAWGLHREVSRRWDAETKAWLAEREAADWKARYLAAIPEDHT